MKEIVLHLLDLAENSVSAGARTIQIDVHEDLDTDRLTVSLADDGRGMDPETVKKVTDPFYTGRTTRNVGLGIPLLKEAAEACNGEMTVQSQVGVGTQIEVTFQHSHIDRMPLGDLAETFRELTVAHPEIHWVDRYTARKDGVERTFEFDDQPVKEILTDVPLTHPDVLAYLHEILGQGLGEAQSILEPVTLQEK
jgi:anti-sigma regulatory factor (Ser/Thr protein kinase)